jgi:hypothetical protein
MFHRTTFAKSDGRRYRCSWWQLGDRIFQYREYGEE